MGADLENPGNDVNVLLSAGGIQRQEIFLYIYSLYKHNCNDTIKDIANNLSLLLYSHANIHGGALVYSPLRLQTFNYLCDHSKLEHRTSSQNPRIGALRTVGSTLPCPGCHD